jgi:hypothetical protein
VVAAGTAQSGGQVHLVAQGDISLDPSLAAPADPTVPTAPADATALSAEMLSADVSVPGSVVLKGNVTTGGADPVRTVTSSGGDIYVAGNLRSADLGGSRQGLTLNAPSGTVYIGGTVDASGTGPSGQTGGAVQINARQVVIAGKLLSSGDDSEVTGGAAGAIDIVAASAVSIAGTVEAFGGNARGPGMVTGGAAAPLTIKAGGDLTLVGTVRLRGGAAVSSSEAGAVGGAAAALTIDADGALTMGGTIDARGGMAGAKAAGGAVLAGPAGVVHVGEKAPPTQISVLVPIVATGGDGDQLGGQGGTFTPEPGTGNLNVAGPKAVDVSGGSALSAPGVGGLVTGGPRKDPGSGGLHVWGEILANGGSIRMGGSGNGADAGGIDFEIPATDGPITIDASGLLSADGGASGGTGTAGGGGHIWLFTKDGDLTVGGRVSARGGKAPDAGGTGGGGGMVYFFSDNNHNALESDKGNLLVDTTGVVDASGGDGANGGSARSDGVKGDWPTFPDHQEQIAIFFNCDGVHGETKNWMENRGQLVARGGSHNGNGGDVVYHGIGRGQAGAPLDSGQSQHHPPAGMQDLSGDGTGMSGDFGSE